MKLLIVTAIKECRKELHRIFEAHEIRVYSYTPIRGVRYDKNKGISTNWYGRETEDFYESVMLFSFADSAVIQKVLEAIEVFNRENKQLFPVKGVVVPIEETVGF